jgi:tRNA pseudouridine55 synthase
LKNYDFTEGEVLFLNKPLNWTSFQLVKKIRYASKCKKIGHAGTLDPLATGLMILCTGKATKRIESYMGLEKVYTGCIRLGETTPSYDRETEVDAQYAWEHIDADMLESARAHFTGKILQYPPIHSAIKVDGKRLYESARKGLEVELKPRSVEIYEFELTNITLPDVWFKVRCSKGTYIRSLAYDFGKFLNSGAVLTELCRTAIGSYQLKDALDLDNFVEQLQRIKERNDI